MAVHLSLLLHFLVLATQPHPSSTVKIIQPIKMRKINCFKGPALKGDTKAFDNATPLTCANFCSSHGRNFTLAGVTHGKMCLCGNAIENTHRVSGCNMPCAGDQSHTCGGDAATDVYMLVEGCPMILLHSRGKKKSECAVIRAFKDAEDCLLMGHRGTYDNGNLVDLKEKPNHNGFVCDIRGCDSVKAKDLRIAPVTGEIQNSVYIRDCSRFVDATFKMFYPMTKQNENKKDIPEATKADSPEESDKNKELIIEICVCVGGTLLLLGFFLFMCRNKPEENEDFPHVDAKEPLLERKMSRGSEQLFESMKDARAKHSNQSMDKD